MRVFTQVNVLIDRHCNARLVDFGLATLLSYSTTTTDLSGKGTVAFMAPELLRFAAQPSNTTDIWALGTLWWQVCDNSISPSITSVRLT
jgi:serine/threonine protein kinase